MPNETIKISFNYLGQFDNIQNIMIFGYLLMNYLEIMDYLMVKIILV